MELIGKTFKSKINGKIFDVIELCTENNRQHYKIVEIESGKILTADKRLFEEMCLANLEMVEEKEV